ncbi:hypothetical protein ABS767_10300 [Sphingomonas sp. ST-64]|uniref:LPXTG-motif cell wall anchor domain-containing protein n=1 Tax=Sphingomonas plantiphila TaxID=3163295 RepID=A0ABW8YM47_9SPHN
MQLDPIPTLSPIPSAPAVESTLSPDIAAAPTAQAPGWLWPLLGGAGLLLAGLAGGWWMANRARRREEEETEKVALAPAAVVVPPPTPGPPARTSPTGPVPAAPASPAPAARVPPPPPAQPGTPAAPVAPPPGPLVMEIRPLRAAIRDGLVSVELELYIQNRGRESADNVRAVLALLGANAEQDAQIAAFHGAARMAPGSEPFSIASGGIHMLKAQVSLPGDQMRVVTVQGKPMFVPIVPVALKWYSGLSIRTLRDAFMVGTVPAPGSDRLGPLWVERAAEGFGRLAAKRYVPTVAAGT